MTTLPLKFVRTSELPDTPAIGTLYFVAGKENQGLWLGVGEGQLEPYTPQQYVIKDEVLEETTRQGLEVKGDTLIIHDEDIATVQNGVLRTSPLFAKVEGDTLIYNYESN